MNNIPKHRVFLSYHHENDQKYKDTLLKLNEMHDIFIDGSVDTGEIDDSLSDDRIKEIIRDDYLKDTTVTVVLAGTETAGRKHVDWEIASSLRDGLVNKKSALIIVNLSTVNNLGLAAYGSEEKEIFYPEETNWISINTASGYRNRYPHLSDRIIDNLVKEEAKVSVLPWEKLKNNPEGFCWLIDKAFTERENCIYDHTRPLMKANKYLI